MNDAEVRLTELRRLTSAQREAELAEQKAAALHREARARRREAEQAVARWLSADAEPCPLFDGMGATPCVAPATPDVAGGDVASEPRGVPAMESLAEKCHEPAFPSWAGCDVCCTRLTPATEGHGGLCLACDGGRRVKVEIAPDSSFILHVRIADEESCYGLIEDIRQFGNWSARDAERYYPCNADIAEAASQAAGRPLHLEEWWEVPGSGNGCRLFFQRVTGQSERDRKHEEWAKTVRDPAIAASASTGPKVATFGRSRLEYQIVPLPDGRWAARYGFGAPGSSYRGSPWRAMPDQAEALTWVARDADTFYRNCFAESPAGRDAAHREKLRAAIDGMLAGIEPTSDKPPAPKKPRKRKGGEE